MKSLLRDVGLLFLMFASHRMAPAGVSREALIFGQFVTGGIVVLTLLDFLILLAPRSPMAQYLTRRRGEEERAKDLA